MHTDDRQTENSTNQQQQEASMTTASAVGIGGKRQDRQQNTSISTGGNIYVKEGLETDQRKDSFKSYDCVMTMTTMMGGDKERDALKLQTATMTSIKTPAVRLVPQSFGSKGTNKNLQAGKKKDRRVEAATLKAKDTRTTTTATSAVGGSDSPTKAHHESGTVGNKPARLHP